METWMRFSGSALAQPIAMLHRCASAPPQLSGMHMYTHLLSAASWSGEVRRRAADDEGAARIMDRSRDDAAWEATTSHKHVRPRLVSFGMGVAAISQKSYTDSARPTHGTVCSRGGRCLPGVFHSVACSLFRSASVHMHTRPCKRVLPCLRASLPGD